LNIQYAFSVFDFSQIYALDITATPKVILNYTFFVTESLVFDDG